MPNQTITNSELLLSHYEIRGLTPWSKVLLEKLTVTQPVKKLPTFYKNRKFFTVFTTARYCSLSWARWIQSTPSHPISLRSILRGPFEKFVDLRQCAAVILLCLPLHNFSNLLTYLLTYLLHGAGQSWKADCTLSLSKNILLSYGTRRFISVHKSPPLDPILS
jgi:hypothetical protein